jgi:Cft2 family RNA processing exonuclease
LIDWLIDLFLLSFVRGAGQEVGRSCILLEFKGKKILLDMGIHPAFSGHASLPYLDHINVEEIELLLITQYVKTQFSFFALE